MSQVLLTNAVTWTQHCSMREWATDNCRGKWRADLSVGFLDEIYAMMQDTRMTSSFVWTFVEQEEEVMFRMVWL